MIYAILITLIVLALLYVISVTETSHFGNKIFYLAMTAWLTFLALYTGTHLL